MRVKEEAPRKENQPSREELIDALQKGFSVLTSFPVPADIPAQVLFLDEKNEIAERLKLVEKGGTGAKEVQLYDPFTLSPFKKRSEGIPVSILLAALEQKIKQQNGPFQHPERQELEKAYALLDQEAEDFTSKKVRTKSPDWDAWMQHEENDLARFVPRTLDIPLLIQEAEALGFIRENGLALVALNKRREIILPALKKEKTAEIKNVKTDEPATPTTILDEPRTTPIPVISRASSPPVPFSPRVSPVIQTPQLSTQARPIETRDVNGQKGTAYRFVPPPEQAKEAVRPTASEIDALQNAHIEMAASSKELQAGRDNTDAYILIPETSSAALVMGQGEGRTVSLAAKVATECLQLSLQTFSDKETPEQVKGKMRNSVFFAHTKLQELPFFHTDASLIAAHIWKNSQGDPVLLFTHIGNGSVWVKKANGALIHVSENDPLAMLHKRGYFHGENEVYEETRDILDELLSLTDLPPSVSEWATFMGNNTSKMMSTLDEGEQRKVRTPSLKNSSLQRLEIQEYPLNKGDLVLLASGGVKNLTKSDIARILRKNEIPEQITQHIVEEAHTVTHLAPLQKQAAQMTSLFERMQFYGQHRGLNQRRAQVNERPKIFSAAKDSTAVILKLD